MVYFLPFFVQQKVHNLVLELQHSISVCQVECGGSFLADPQQKQQQIIETECEHPRQLRFAPRAGGGRGCSTQSHAPQGLRPGMAPAQRLSPRLGDRGSSSDLGMQQRGREDRAPHPPQPWGEQSSAHPSTSCGARVHQGQLSPAAFPGTSDSS